MYPCTRLTVRLHTRLIPLRSFVGAYSNERLTRVSIAELEPTCFANTLSHLTRLKGPIRKVRSAGDLLSEEDAKNAPREVMRLVNHMMSGEEDAVSGHTHYPEFG